LSGSAVKGIIKIPGEIITYDGIATRAWMQIEKADLCPGCAESLRGPLKAWWSPGETMVEFESVEELTESFDE
jgi:hypothetical protein